MADDFIIVRKHPDLVKYVDALQKKNAEQLSFYPLTTFEREAENGRLFLALLNGEPCGYIYTGAWKNEVKCHQVCIQYDARRRLYGAALVVNIEALALNTGSFAVSLRCGFDLEANVFWRTMGYTCVRQVKGGVRRMRTINVWRKQLQPELFIDLHMEPARGKTDSTLWSKHRQTGIVTGFNRGKQLQDYRATLEEKETECQTKE
jgi:hypothetical protein